MKLSEAIRAGSQLRPMAKNDFFVRYQFSVKEDDVHSCALGAAYEAVVGGLPSIGVGGTVYQRNSQGLAINGELHASWPYLLDAWCESPARMGATGVVTLQEVIATMNDWGHFTREQIADWLESVGL
jgi:hypothetical protein